MKRIQREWLTFESQVLPAEASPTQRAEMRKAFFAGASGVLHLLATEIDDGPEVTDGDLKMVEELHRETADFAAQLTNAGSPPGRNRGGVN